METEESEEGTAERKPVLLSWGCGEFGQHGHGHNKDVKSSDSLVFSINSQKLEVSAIACGASHTLALTVDGNLYSWGNGNSGQLGLGKSQSYESPQRVEINSNIKGISCGSRHSYLWSEDGKCYSFGNNFNAQLGYDFRRPDYKENQGIPLYVDTLLNQIVDQVACGTRHSLFLFDSGTVSAVGSNNKGQLGNNTKCDSVVPIKVAELCHVITIGCGSNHSLAATSSGEVFAWGYSKACGSKNTNLLFPSCKMNLNSDYVVKLCGGDSHSMMLTCTGKLYTWGSNFEGQLGLGEEIDFTDTPLRVSLKKEEETESIQNTIKDISCGENTCAAFTENHGKMYMWGINSSCMIRNDKPPRYFQRTPFLINLGSWVVQKVACGSWHVAVIATSTPKGTSQRTPSINHTTKPTNKKDIGKTITEEIVAKCEYSDHSEAIMIANPRVLVTSDKDLDCIQNDNLSEDKTLCKEYPEVLNFEENNPKSKFTEGTLDELNMNVYSTDPVLVLSKSHCIKTLYVDKTKDLLDIYKESFNIVQTDCSSFQYRPVLEFQYDKFPEAEQTLKGKDIFSRNVENDAISPGFMQSVTQNVELLQGKCNDTFLISKTRMKMDSNKWKKYNRNEQDYTNSSILPTKKTNFPVASNSVRRNDEAKNHLEEVPQSKEKTSTQSQYHDILIGNLPLNETTKEHFAKIQDVMESKRVVQYHTEEKTVQRFGLSGRSRSFTNLKDPFNNSNRIKPATRMQRTFSFTQTPSVKNETKKQTAKKFTESAQSSHLTQSKVSSGKLHYEKGKRVKKLVPPLPMSNGRLSQATSSTVNTPILRSSKLNSLVSKVNKPTHKGMPVFSSGASWRKRTEDSL